MRAIKPAALVLLATFVGVAGWTAYRGSWWLSRYLTPATVPQGPNTEPPVVEFREVHSGPHGESRTLLSIDRTGLATLQTLPLGSGSKTTRVYLGCDEFAALPEELRYPLDNLRSSYGNERGANEGEVSVVSRFGGRERRVVWRNPESNPKPPEGAWAGLVAPLEDIRRKAEETPNPTPKATQPEDEILVEYGHLSSGAVGTYITLLSIHKSGRVTLGNGLGVPWPLGDTQLSSDELSNLLRTIEEAKFMDFQRCYGKHAPVNPQNSWITYQRNGTGKFVTWMSDGSDPKPPDGWFQIVAILDQIHGRIKPRQGEPSRPRRC
jgi:hypothetical protein